MKIRYKSGRTWWQIIWPLQQFLYQFQVWVIKLWRCCALVWGVFIGNYPIKDASGMSEKIYVVTDTKSKGIQSTYSYMNIFWHPHSMYINLPPDPFFLAGMGVDSVYSPRRATYAYPSLDVRGVHSCCSYNKIWHSCCLISTCLLPWGGPTLLLYLRIVDRSEFWSITGVGKTPLCTFLIRICMGCKLRLCAFCDHHNLSTPSTP